MTPGSVHRGDLAPVSSARWTGGRHWLLLVRAWATREYHSTHQQRALGWIWSVLQPLLVVVIYAVVFQKVLRVEGDGLPYLSFIVAGLVVFRMVTAGLAAFTSIVANANVITKMYFPREVLPLGTALAGGVDMLAMAAIALVAAWIQGIRPTIHLLALPLPLLVGAIGAAALAIVGSTLTVFLRDVDSASNFVAQFLLFSAPIMYPRSNFGDAQWWVDANPLAATTEAVRDVMLRGHWPDWGLMSIHLVVAIAALMAAIAYIRSVEHRMPDLV